MKSIEYCSVTASSACSSTVVTKHKEKSRKQVKQMSNLELLLNYHGIINEKINGEDCNHHWVIQETSSGNYYIWLNYHQTMTDCIVKQGMNEVITKSSRFQSKLLRLQLTFKINNLQSNPGTSHSFLPGQLEKMHAGLNWEGEVATHVTFVVVHLYLGLNEIA